MEEIMHTATGYSILENPVEAATEAASKALHPSENPVLTILFTTDAYDQRLVVDTVKEVTRTSHLVGMCAGGIIAGSRTFRQGIAVLTLTSDALRVATSLQTGLSNNPFDVGVRAAEVLLASGCDDGIVFVFPDGFGANIAELVRGLYSKMGPSYKYIGGGAGDNLKFFRTYQFTEAGVETDAVAVALLSGAPVGTSVGHGWKPHGERIVITEAKGKRIFEIDGQPAFDAYAARFLDITIERFPEYGMKHPLGFTDISGNYLIRDPLSVSADKSIDCVTEVPSKAIGHIMHGRIEDLVETAEMVAREAARGISQPAFAIICDCISRYLLMGDEFSKELHAIQTAIGEAVPTIGVLTFGEVGAFVDVPFFHNKTVAIAVGGR